MTTSTSTEAQRAPGAYEGTSVVAMRDTAKWLISASAAIAALLVAGLQITDVADFKSPRTVFAFSIAVLAILCGVWAAGFVIRRGADVLAGSAVSFADLVALDFESQLRAQQRGDPLLQSFQLEPLLSELHRQRRVVYRSTTAESPTALLALANEAHAGLRSLEAGRSCSIDGRTFQPTDIASARSCAEVFDDRVRDVLGVAALFETTIRYRRLLAGLRVSAPVLVAAATVFAVAAAIDDPAPLSRVTGPQNVIVYGSLSTVDERLADCDFVTGVDAVAVDGTWDRPVLVIRAQDDCGPARVTAGRDAIVVPVLEK